MPQRPERTALMCRWWRTGNSAVTVVVLVSPERRESAVMDSPEQEPAADDLAELSDEELQRELTIAASAPHRDERYEQLLAELDRRRADPRD